MLRIRKHINQLISIGLSFWMVFISMGFSMNLHICQDQIKTLSIIGEIENCQTMKNCSSKKHCEVMVEEQSDYSTQCQNDCCTEESIWLKSDQEQFKVNLENVVPESTIQFLLAFTKSLQNNDNDNSNVSFVDYNPPPLIGNIYKAVQSFRC